MRRPFLIACALGLGALVVGVSVHVLKSGDQSVQGTQQSGTGSFTLCHHQVLQGATGLPMSGAPGALLRVSGQAGGLNEAGAFVHETEVQFWWNLDPSGALSALSGSSHPPGLCPGRVFRLARENVESLSTYALSFRVPSVPAGDYAITKVSRSGDSTTAFASVFTVSVGQ